jgi:sulfite reductase (ferredoxin)
MQASSSAFAGSLNGLATRQPCQPSTSARGGLTVTAVATPSRPPASNKAKRSKVEIIKEKSDFLRHPLMQVRFC